MGAAAGRDRWRTVAVGAAVVVAVMGSGIGVGYDRIGAGDNSTAVATGLAVGLIAVVGAVVALAAPGNKVGWVMLVAAGLFGVGVAMTEAGVEGVVVRPGSVPGAPYLAALGPALRACGWFVAVLAVPALFPDGHLPGPRWRWLGWCIAVAVLCLFLGNVLSSFAQENRLEGWRSPLALPSAYGGVADALSTVALLLGVVAAAGCVAGLVSRWRRRGPLVRQQLALLAMAACPPPLIAVAVIFVPRGLPGWMFSAALVPYPITIAIAILHHGLYDLRRAANQTLLWLAMSAVVIALYAAVMALVAALGATEASRWPPALAAAVAGLALVPVRTSLQRAVNRAVYGRWREPYAVLAGLGAQLAAAGDIDRLLEDTVEELTAGLALSAVAVHDADGAALAGASVPGDTVIPLHAYGSAVGSLHYRLPGRLLSMSEQQLVRDLAQPLGAALHARMLHHDLQRARERLVTAREEERRRLRRDLHDGLGPALAGLRFKAETARALLPVGAGPSAIQLQGLSEEIARTVADVRRLVEGLRPPALDDLGLVEACRRAIERLTEACDIRAQVRVAEAIPAMPAAVEVAAYRIVVEASTNIVRHAGATGFEVSFSVGSGKLAVAVRDDGAGLSPRKRAGSSGVAIMRERAEELGGTVEIVDSPAGVTVEARLPLDATGPGSTRQARATP